MEGPGGDGVFGPTLLGAVLLGGGDEDATGEGGAEASGAGSSGMQLVAVDADKSKKEKLSAASSVLNASSIR